jgi:glyoxylase-like metal-dependent hydrolase (beta-lactamase superfamily II)
MRAIIPVSRWRVGTVPIERVLELEVAVPREVLSIGQLPDQLHRNSKWARPHFVDDEGRIIFALAACCIESEGKKIVIDPCLSFDDRLDGDADAQAERFLDQAMAAAGFAPESVDLVINTHVDGLGWNLRPAAGDESWMPSFPNAKYVWSRAELERVHGSEFASVHPTLVQRLDHLCELGCLEAVEPPVHFTAEVNVAPSPGHTTGNMEVWVLSHGESAVIVGDFLVSPLQAADPDWTELDESHHESRRLRRELLKRCEAEDTLVVGPHFGSPGAGHVSRDGDAWRITAAGSGAGG